MSKVTAIPIDPTIPTVTVPSAAGDIILCCDFGILIDAESELRRKGYDVALLSSLRPQAASEVREFFIIAARHFQPDLSYDELKKLFTLKNAVQISAAIGQVWAQAFPEQATSLAAPENPPAPSDPGESNTGNGSSPQPESTSDSVSESSAG